MKHALHLTALALAVTNCAREPQPAGGPEMTIRLARLATDAAFAASLFVPCPNDGRTTHQADGTTVFSKCGIAMAGVRAEVDGTLTIEDRTARCGGRDRPTTFITGTAKLGGDLVGELEPKGYYFCAVQDAPAAVNLVGFLRFGTGDFVKYDDKFYAVGTASW